MKLPILILTWFIGVAGNAAVTNYVFSTSSSSVLENIAAQQICFTVRLTPAPAGSDAPSVNYASTNGTAEGNTSAGNDGHHDYHTMSGTVSFASGFTAFGTGQSTYATKSVCTPVYDDTVYEGLSEYFNFNLSNPLPNAGTGDTALIASGSESVEGIITENDTTSLPTVSISDANGAENNGPFTFRVTLSRAASAVVTMNYTTRTNTARDNTSPVGLQDFNATSGTLTFPIGVTEQDISVNIINDNIVETLNERFSVELSNLSANVSPYDVSGEGTITDDDGVTSEYCSPYRGMISLNEYHHMITYKDIGTDHPVQLGNFIELKRDPLHINPDFQPDNDWTIVVYTGTGGTAKTFTFAQRDDSCGVNTPYLIFNYDTYNLPGTAVDVAVFDGQGKEVDFFSFNNPHYRESNCIAHPDATGASFPFDTDFSIGNAADKDIFRDPDGTGDWTSNGSGANSGATRCWEPASLTFGRLDAVDSDVTPTFSPYNGILRTKISNKNAPLKVVSLNATKTGYQVLTGVVVKAFRIDSDGSVSEVIGDVELNGVSTKDIPNFSRVFAKKDSRILFQYCDVNGSIVGRYDQCIANSGILKSSASFDNFAIRPKEFYNNLTSGLTLKAGVGHSIIFQAHDELGAANSQYNESETVTLPSFVVEANISDTTKMCAQPTINLTPRVSFLNGTVTNSYALNNVGDFNVTMHEIAGAEFAHVDYDDTNDALRIITPFSKQIIVVPDHFGLDGNLTNGSNGFTYLSNFEDFNTSASRNISARLDLNITAQRFDGNTTTNYASACYAKDGNITVLIDTFGMTPAGAVTKLLWYEKNHDTNGSMAIPVDHFVMPILHTAFDATGANGTALVKYLLNFDRNQTRTVDPKLMVVQSVTATDADAVTGTEIPILNSAYYVYGRNIPRDVRVFGSVPFSANGWYEVFGTTAIGTTALAVSKNDSQWSTNKLHNDVSDGDANVTVVVSATSTTLPVWSTSNNTGIESYLFNAETPPYSAKAHILTTPWLWYGLNASPYANPVAGNSEAACLTHPCFNINVVPAVGATGSAKSTNTATKASKKSDSSGWRSTTDYAPAVR